MTAASLEARVRRICAGAGLAGVAALALASQLPDALARPEVVAAFAVAILTTQLLPLHLVHGNQSEALHLDEVFFVPMVLILAPVQTVAAFALALAAAAVVSRRGLLKGVFNVGSMTASIACGVGTAQLLGLSGAVTGRDVAAAVAGGLVHCAVSSMAVSGVIAVSQGAPFRGILLDGLPVRLATWCGSLCVGVLAVMASAQSQVALLVATVPAVVLQLAYAGALQQWQERRTSEALYEAAARIRAQVDGDAIRRELVAVARELLPAGTAGIVDPDSPAPATATRVGLDAYTALEVDERPTGGAWTRAEESLLRELAAVATGALTNALLFEQIEAVTRSLGEGVVAVDRAGAVTFANPAAETMLGWRRGELLGREIADAVDPGGRAAQPDGGVEWVHLPRLCDGETLRMDEHVIARRDGTALDVALTASPVLRDGAVVGAVIVFRDVRDRKALEKRLVHQAFHDPLTGLPNRALFLDRLDHARARGTRDGATQAVLFVDIDRFKVINDSLGHRVGDQVLQTVASRIVGVLRPSDTVARFGGDEFTVLLEQVADGEEAAAAAERILRALQPPMEAGGREIVVTVSIGIAVSQPGNASADLIAAADIAMYQAKSRGKNRSAVAAADADESALARLDLEMALRRAIEDGELEVHYQPVVDARTSALYGFEALVRWRHPRLGLLAPSHFMDVAEESGLVLPLGDWVLEQACTAAVTWQHRHPGTPIVMAVNLSARQFQQADLCERVRAVLENTGLDPRLLALEITETAVMEDTEATLGVLRALKQLKVRLSIDDFGTGYSSLSYLKRFPVDSVKIDRSFIEGLTAGPVDREIVHAVIRLASAVGMQTVAEGVETSAQEEALRLLGCTLIQGFLHSRPATMEHLERTLDLRLPRPRASSDSALQIG